MGHKNKISQFLNNSSGNMVIMTAMTLPVLLLGVGVAVSYSDAVNHKSKLQSHADIMSLTMAKKNHEYTRADAIDYFNEYISTQIGADEDCSFTLDDNPSEAIVTCSGEIQSFLDGVLKKKSVPYSVSATASMSIASTFEVAFVFDISLSMSGAEIEDLKKGLLTISESALFDDVDSRISLIPFANTVRLGPEFEKFVTPGSGYVEAGGVYNGCFNRDATSPYVDLKSNPTFPLVRNTLNSGKVVCQDEKMTAVFHKEATDWVVKDMEKDIETAFGTGMSDALVWGFRSLDPSLRGVMSSASKYPLDSFRGSTKHIIMMTDGRPYDRAWSGPARGAVDQALSLARFESVCSALPFDAKGINFHLINYNNKRLSAEHLEVFRDCVAGEGEFYDVDAGGLADVLNEITSVVSGLRLIQ